MEEPTDSWFHETPQSSDMLMRATLDVLDSEAIASRWYARADTDGDYCIMDADRVPSEQWPPVLQGMTERLARHVAQVHNAWLAGHGTESGATTLPEKVRCPSCRRRYTTTKAGRIRLHYWDGYLGGKRCVCSGMTMNEAREFAALKQLDAELEAEYGPVDQAAVTQAQRTWPRSVGMGTGPSDLSEREGLK